MKKHIIIMASSVFISLALQAQIKMNNNISKSALNSNVTESIVIASVKNTQSSYANNVTDNISSSYSAAYSGSASSALVNSISPISSRFGYFSPFYAEIITVHVYSNYYKNVPLIKYMAPSGEYYKENPTVALSILRDRILPAYRYFVDNKPGYVPYQYERPASISIDIGVTKPIPLQVDPANQAYWLYNTRFVRTFSLTY
ncbi:hypothetical protein EZ449_06205 [Pedobacter frigidisoli]|uniref:Uncharacterized protein n=1 Tax=Pedobacter frigidisoli TaxID=2530455 RepID=A0A4R0P2Q3_9SPHI|nr:hypothetical protein [Pedobacter frigidisoli]TCD11084.1 hypothetical protein EZ449_06205 [Pedobacter frigidisoli]